MNDSQPILYGIATSCMIVGAYIAGSAVWEKYQNWKQQKEGKSK